MNSIEVRIKETMSRVLKINTDDINDNSAINTIAEWDSIRHVELMLELEKEFELRFEDSEIPAMINYLVIVATIKSYLD